MLTGAAARLGTAARHRWPSFAERCHSRLFSKGAQSYPRKGQSVRQKRVASQVQEVVCRALQQDTDSSQYLDNCGFELERVEMSADLRRAYVFWKASPGLQVTAEKRLNLMGKRLRSIVFSELCLPFSPSIEFVDDIPDRRAREVEAVLDRLREIEASEGEDLKLTKDEAEQLGDTPEKQGE